MVLILNGSSVYDANMRSDNLICLRHLFTFLSHMCYHFLPDILGDLLEEGDAQGVVPHRLLKIINIMTKISYSQKVTFSQGCESVSVFFLKSDPDPEQTLFFTVGSGFQFS